MSSSATQTLRKGNTRDGSLYEPRRPAGAARRLWRAISDGVKDLSLIHI